MHSLKAKNVFLKGILLSWILWLGQLNRSQTTLNVKFLGIFRLDPPPLQKKILSARVRPSLVVNSISQIMLLIVGHSEKQTYNTGLLWVA
jgi:hypothetical protein